MARCITLTWRPLLIACTAISLTACTGPALPSTPGAGEPEAPAEPSAAASLAEAEPAQPEPPALIGCAVVGIGLDLNALPTGSSEAAIASYTRTRANEFTKLAAPDVVVEFGFYPGFSVFDAKVRATSHERALEQCKAITNAFIPTVPGRPGSGQSGGSITTPCTPCLDAACPDAYALAVDWANQKWPESDVGRDAFEPAEAYEPIDLDHNGAPDLVLRRGSGTHNTTHLVFWVRDGCPTLVGEFSASALFGYACLTETHNGLCDLIASELMIHGEAQRSTYRFDGTSYQEVPGSAVLSEPPPKR